MVQRPSGESMSKVIKTLSNNMFDDFVSHVEYWKGNIDCGDIFLVHVNNFINVVPTTRSTNIIHTVNDGKEKIVSTEGYYKTIYKYLDRHVSVLLVGTVPETQELEIIQ